MKTKTCNIIGEKKSETKENIICRISCKKEILKEMAKQQNLNISMNA